MRAHFAKQNHQIGDLRFAGGIFEDGFAVGQGGGHENVLGAGDGDFFEIHTSAFQAGPGRASFDVSMSGVDFGSHFFERREMEVDRTGADRTAAGQRDTRYTGASQGRAERQNRSAHGLDQLVGRYGLVDGGRSDVVVRGGEFGNRHAGAHVRQELAHGDDVPNHRQVAKVQRFSGQKAGGHGGQGGVFRTADAHGAAQRFAAGDEELVH